MLNLENMEKQKYIFMTPQFRPLEMNLFSVGGNTLSFD